MGLTLVEKILLRASSSKELADFIYARLDFCFGNDITAPLAVKEFDKAQFSAVFNANKIGFVCDHFVPARDFKAANNVKLLREFATRFKIKHFFDIDTCGIEHVFLIEQGLVCPGALVIGADSHTCTFGGIGAASFGVGSTDLAAAMKSGRCWFKMPQTIKFIYKGKLNKWVCGKDLILSTIGKIGVDGALYKVMEFSGPVIKKMGVEERLTMTNMAIEAGAKTGVIEPDETTFKYLRQVQGKKFKFKPAMRKLKSDMDAKYSEVIEIDVTKMQPQVACPHLPSNVKGVGALRKIKLDQVVIGSCTNGRISDLRIAAKILKKKRVKKGLRVIVIPASHIIYRAAEKEGLLKVFFEAGCIVSPPTCGPCLGGHGGILDKGEVALATTNRNFIGRMGHPESFVYLSSPAVAAASAIKGRITHPDEVS
ncbi:MAG: 3-isopropylmalate dehydratase large subunit [Candidatus Omnitrophota bacterium]|nr:MAG: 3-isopropylmalate dehydratase large subunit [Candidatus Omnitrophota bacterium]